MHLFFQESISSQPCPFGVHENILKVRKRPWERGSVISIFHLIIPVSLKLVQKKLFLFLVSNIFPVMKELSNNRQKQSLRALLYKGCSYNLGKMLEKY